MKNGVTMADIADALGVSKVTVSNALAGRAGVSQELREKIKQTAIRMGYMVKQSSESSGYSVGVIVSGKYVERGESYYWEIYWELASVLKSRGAAVVFEMIKVEDERKKNVPLCLNNGKCDAVIILGPLGNSYLELIKDSFEIPMVLLDSYSDRLMIDAVISSGYYGMYRMTEYLIRKGHVKIGYVGSILESSSIMDRYHGYCKALQENKIPIREDWILEDRDIETGEIEIGKLPEEMPSAFACNCDFIANELIKKLIENGYRVPEDISIVGYDNYSKNKYYNIGITSYDINIHLMAVKAVDRILDKLAGARDDGDDLQVISGKLIEKDSVKEKKSETV
ncbi:MAG TPA: LacI family DNA-binding transcriptional regulator [Candidatus Mediterraneibacter norfolkensis]|nr:LacI family DNA-binding transcriptional regulator [Candidatus Mediterraneibacter norfolkensis]